MNKRFGLGGTLFQGQAKIKHIAMGSYCRRVIPYVHLNPVSANLVCSPDEWRFSNYLEWCDKRRSILCDPELRNNYFPNPKEYETYIREYQMEKESKAIGEFLFEEP